MERLKKVKINVLLCIVLITTNSSSAQSFFNENREVYSNYNVFSETLATSDTIVFINNMDDGKFPSLKEDSIPFSKRTYYRWNFTHGGASLAYQYYEKPYWRSTVSYYPFQVKQAEIFGKDVLIFLYEKKLYFFEIIEDRPAVHNSGSLIILVKC